MPNYPQRKSPRLQGYDYSQSGAYFVTICTYQRQHLFGTIRDGEMQRSTAGDIAAACWQAIPDHYPDVELDAFVVMPNHVHGIVFLMRIGHALPLPDSPLIVGTRHAASAVSTTQSPTLGNIIGSYKSAVTADIRRQQPEQIVWQPRYHDHIIRDEAGLNQIREYVFQNPALWAEDTFYDA